MKKIIIICTLLVLVSSSCTTYFSPDRYANPRHKFESGNKRYERKMRRIQRESKPTIDPLRMRH
jgi:hypothetical protein